MNVKNNYLKKLFKYIKSIKIIKYIKSIKIN